MSPYSDVLLAFYGSEVAGEAIYSVPVGAAPNDVERLKWATLMHLETETLLKYPVRWRSKEIR